MLTSLKEQPVDRIIGLSAAFRADERAHKIDLGVGVYKDATGNTPIMRAIKTAEKRLWDEETTKSYTALLGDGGFHKVMGDLVLGDSVDRDRVSFCATPGGTGAVHHVLELAKLTGNSPSVWFSNPTWGNHLTIAKHLGMQTKAYRYFNNETCAVEFDALMEDLSTASEGDIIALHGCCHNPTGANLNPAQWEEVANLLLEKNLIPFIDIAYQGFGDGLEEDTFGTRLLASKMPQLLIAASCSKNFGIYRERTGIVMVVSPDAATAKLASGNLSHINRQNFSFPPDHGARLVTMILSDAELRADWTQELEEVRLGMLDTRQKLAAALQAASGSDRFGFLAEHRGMFSRLGASEDKVDALREKHAIYAVFDSRINIAGIKQENIETIAKAIIDVGI